VAWEGLSGGRLTLAKIQSLKVLRKGVRAGEAGGWGVGEGNAQ